jgi:hypothetical protein
MDVGNVDDDQADGVMDDRWGSVCLLSRLVGERSRLFFVLYIE